MALKPHHYLTDGVLEAYLLGLVTEQEKEELDQILATDPDVLAQLSELEATLEGHFLRNAVPPPPGIRDKIELRIRETDIQKWEDIKQTDANPKSTQSASAESEYLHVEINDTHIRVHKNWRTAFIAIFILAKVFLILGLYYYFKSNSLEQEVDRLKSATEQSAPLSRSRIK